MTEVLSRPERINAERVLMKISVVFQSEPATLFTPVSKIIFLVVFLIGANSELLYGVTCCIFKFLPCVFTKDVFMEIYLFLERTF